MVIYNKPFPVLTLDQAISGVPGIEVTNLREHEASGRPQPDFLYGPVSAEARRHFHNDHYQPPVSIFRVRGVEVFGPWSHGSLLIRGDVFLRYTGVSLDPLSEDLQSRLQEFRRIPRDARRIAGDTVLLVNGGHQIYGHWLVDFLPKLFLLDSAGLRLDALNILLPTNMGAFGRDLLGLLGVKDERIIRYDPDCETIVPETLIVPSTLRWGGRCSPLFADAVGFLNRLIEREHRVPSSPHRKIFLSRGNARSRPLVNRRRIEEMAVDAGFSLIEPETHSLLEQIGILRDASHVIGQYGSALHATIFSRPGVVVGALHGPLPATFDALQSGIGERLGQRTGYVFASSSSGIDDPWAIDVDENDFAACLHSEFAD